MAKITKRDQGVMEFVETIFLHEMGQIIMHQGAAFLKFIILLQGIEFLGACYDNKEFKKKEVKVRLVSMRGSGNWVQVMGSTLKNLITIIFINS